MKILFLDDDEVRHTTAQQETIGLDVTFVRTVPEAIKALSETVFDLALLDHDLGGKTYVPSEHEDTGAAVARAIAQMPLERRPARVYIHSYNMAGAHAMVSTLREAATRALWIPFGPLLFKATKEYADAHVS